MIKIIKIFILLCLLSSCKQNGRVEVKVKEKQKKIIAKKQNCFEYSQVYGNPVKYYRYRAKYKANIFNSFALESVSDINKSIVLEVTWKKNKDSLITVWYEETKTKNVVLHSLIYSKDVVF